MTDPDDWTDEDQQQYMQWRRRLPPRARRILDQLLETLVIALDHPDGARVTLHPQLRKMHPELRAFIDHVVVPALVNRWKKDAK
jgi:hypothetical protein